MALGAPKDLEAGEYMDLLLRRGQGYKWAESSRTEESRRPNPQRAGRQKGEQKERN